MLQEEKCRKLFEKVISLRKFYKDDVESYTHGLYGFSFNLDEVVESCTLIEDGPDVYHLISQTIAKEHNLLWDRLALYTEGWAAPADASESDVPPSQHPESKRIRMLCVISKETMLVESIISLDGEDKMMYDSSGKGKLADALKSIYFNKNKGKNVNINVNSFYF